MSMDKNPIIPNQAADRYAEMWADELREQLRIAGKHASGRLIQSIRADALVTAIEAGIIVKGADYLKFVDAGVSGTDKVQPGSPYRYTKYAGPPISALQNWIRIKNIQPRSGMSREGLAFAIQRKIWKFGVRPTHVLQKTVTAMATNKTALQFMEQAIATNLENEIITELNSDQPYG